MSLFRHSLLVGDDLHVPGYRVATDPGAVGAGMLWEDTDTGTLRKRNLTNTGWVIIGGAASIYFNVADYGALGDGSTDDTAAFKLAIAAAAATSYGGTIYVPPGDYYLSGNPFIDVMGLVDWAGKGITVDFTGARLRLGRQLAIPGGVLMHGNPRFGSRIAVASAAVIGTAYVWTVNVVSVTLTSNVVTVVTDAAHRLEVGSTARLDAVTNTVFNGGWPVASVPSTTSFTFAMTPATVDTTSSAGTVQIPLVVLGDPTVANHTSRPHLRDCLVDCGGVAASIGVYSNSINETGDVRSVTVYNAYKYGLLFERAGMTAILTGPQNYEITNLEVFMVPSVSAVGVKLSGNYNSTRGIRGLTVSAVGTVTAGCIQTGLELYEVTGIYTELHLEGCVDGVLVDSRSGAADEATSGASVVLGGVTGHATNTTLVRLKNRTKVHDITLMGLAKVGGTNILVDETCEPDTTLTDTYLGFYATSGGVSPKRWSTSANVLDSAGLIGDTRYQLVTITTDPTSTGWANKFHFRADATSGAFTVTLPPVADNAGRIVYVDKKDTSGNVVTIDGNASETIGRSGALTYKLMAPGEGLLLQSDGSTGWDILSEVLGGQDRGSLATVTADGVSWSGVYHRRANATAGAFSVTLPAAADNTNRILIVSKSDSTANAVTVDGNGAETINGAATFALTAQYDAITLHCDGSGWTIIGVGV